MTLRKVTDESAVEEGGREVALKKGRAEREGGRQARSITVLKKTSKDLLLARKIQRVTSHDQETLEKARKQKSLD